MLPASGSPLSASSVASPTTRKHPIVRPELSACALGAALLLPLSAHADGKPAWETSGDILEWALPAAAFGLSYGLDPVDGGRSAAQDDRWLDWPGPGLNGSPRHDVLLAFARTVVVTEALKLTIDEQRPNGGDHAFPSGHSALAFMGAEAIRDHYGGAWGAPAYALAAWTGYTRVRADEHYWHDVIAGALIGIAANHDLSEWRSSAGTLSLAPTLMPLDTAFETHRLGDDDGTHDLPSVAGRLDTLHHLDDLPYAPALSLRLQF